MELSEEAKKLAKFKNSLIKTSDLKAMDISYPRIQDLIQEGVLEKIKHGYYRLISENDNTNEAALIAQLYPDGILCMYIALFYYGYSDRTPLNWDIAINKNVSKSRFNLDYPYVKPYYLEPEQLTYGVSIADFEGTELHIFDRDRLICECMKYEQKMDREIFNKAIQAYIHDPEKSIHKLLGYAKQRRIDRKLKSRIGIWL